MYFTKTLTLVAVYAPLFNLIFIFIGALASLSVMPFLSKLTLGISLLMILIVCVVCVPIKPLKELVSFTAISSFGSLNKSSFIVTEMVSITSPYNLNFIVLLELMV